jgi:PTS system fructose-specific IIC component
MSTGNKIRQSLMTGVSYMIPFVAAGGILIALGFLLGTIFAGTDQATGGIRAYDAAAMNVIDGNINPLDGKNWAFLIFWLGKAAFAFFVPVLAGYIAFAIADRPGIAPGFVAGVLATGLDGNPLGTGTGFLGAILGGFLAGYLALWISRWGVPNWVRPLMPVVIIPVVASILTGIVMVFVLKAPVGWLASSLTSGLASLSTAGLVITGVVLGLMMAFDMGGPVNKVAYVFATTGLGTALAANADITSANEFKIMAIVMAAGMTPPLGLALATVLKKSQFTEYERENGKAAWLMGAAFISEGAIPFAAADPLRVIPSIMIGSGVTGAVVALFGVTMPAPHGGIFVFPLVGGSDIGQIGLYVLALAIGTVVTALLVNVAKGIGQKA